jgi:hypothetical protein
MLIRNNLQLIQGLSPTNCQRLDADSATFSTLQTTAFAFHRTRPGFVVAAKRDAIQSHLWIKTERLAAGFDGDFAMTPTWTSACAGLTVG